MQVQGVKGSEPPLTCGNIIFISARKLHLKGFVSNVNSTLKMSSSSGTSFNLGTNQCVPFSKEWMPHSSSSPFFLFRLGPAINDRFMALKVLERSANWPSFQLHCSLRYLTPCQVIFYPKKSFSSFLGHVLWFLLWMLFFSSGDYRIVAKK